MHGALPFHPLSNAYRLMKGVEYDALVENIRQRGLISPITLYEGQVLDGRNRQRACLDSGQPLLTVAYEGDDPLGHMLALNSHRRHDSESQRALAASRLATLERGRPGNAHQCAITQDEAADRFNVSRRIIQYARTALDGAEPEIVEAVEDGEMTVKVAATLAGQPREKQLARLERDRRKANGTYRHKDDYYRTPPACVRALLAVETFADDVWEPACGDGAISEVLLDAGHTVISTDLIDRGYGTGGVDFLGSTVLGVTDLITNPPYRLADKFALHALKLGVRKMALLCRLAWLEGQERYERLYSQQKLARIWVFSQRQTLWRGDECSEDDGGMTAYAWFVFERDHGGAPTLGWLTAEAATC